MKNHQIGGPVFVSIGLACALSAPASASLTFITGGPALNRPTNLVTNGSFEEGAPPAGQIRFWATGTTNMPFGVPGGWQSSGAAQTYANWGNDGSIVTPRTRFSDVLPHGTNGMYFGNLFAATDVAPTFQPDGRVTFASPPTITSPDFGQPCVLWQTVPTDTNVAPAYAMSFWVSGENAQQGVYQDGLFGFRITNVLPGDPMQYLTVPGGQSALGASIRFDYQFVPLNPLLPVTIEFTNWGHFNPSSPQFTTELVLDDVIINAIPTPGSAAVGGLALALGSARRRRR